MNDKLKRTEYYALGDRYEPPLRYPESWAAKWTGEYREPKKGEWYLSGAIINAYRADYDMHTKFYIARIVKVRKVWRTEEVKDEE